jgi:hypothetical protein
MSRKRQPLRWEVWSQDTRVRFARDDGYIQVKAPSIDGSLEESEWCRVFGRDVDLTVRQLLHEMKWKPKAP